jgi:hypothetical protein
MVATSQILTPAQIAQLQYAYDVNSNADQNFSGVWHDSYSVLYDYLTVKNAFGVDTPRTDVPVDPQTWLWLKGARFVNSNEGAFGTLIRDYTIAQFRQRYRRPPTPEQMNRASNAIAMSFIGQWLGRDARLGPTQPTITETGLYDAGAAASRVFGSLGGTGDPDNAAGWAGTILFPNLGAPDFYRNLILNALEGPNATGSFPSGNAQLPGLVGIDHGSYDVIAAAAAVETFAREHGFNSPLPLTDQFAAAWRQFWSTATFSTVALEAETNAVFWHYYGLTPLEFEPHIGNDTLGTLGT